MSSDRSTTGTATTGAALWRRIALGTGPLKRTSDRLQFLARVLLVCSLLMALPIALAVATATHSEASAEAAAQAAERHQVDATLTEDAHAVSDDDGVAAATERAAVVWIGASGLERADRVAVTPGTEAGAVIQIWVDRNGEPTSRPLDGDDVTGRSICGGVGTYLGLAVAACGLYLAVRMTIDRGRMRRWAADWAAVEPVWTRSAR